jgi:hypothetical protein
MNVSNGPFGCLIGSSGISSFRPTGCHLWTGFVTADGYGQFFLSGRLHLARRVAYELCVGPIEPNERVFSTCGVRACVIPEGAGMVNPYDEDRLGVVAVPSVQAGSRQPADGVRVERPQRSEDE